MIRGLARIETRRRSRLCNALHGFYARTGPICWICARAGFGDIDADPKNTDIAIATGKDRAMRLTIEIVAAALLMFCISATSAAFAAGKAGKSADGLELLLQRREISIPRRALRRDPQAVRRKILCELLRRQDAVGDVRRAPSLPLSSSRPSAQLRTGAGTHNHRLQSRWDRSLQSGLSSSISRVFQSRCRFFNCFSRAMASRGDANVSTWTRRCTPYFLTNSEPPRPLRCCSSRARRSLVTPM